MKLVMNNYINKSLVLFFIILLSITACSKSENLVLPLQMKLPQRGEEIMIVHTSVGEIKIKLLPEIAPITVNAIKQAYVNNMNIDIPFEKSFHANLIKMIKAVDSDSNKELFKEDYKVETNNDVRHYPGAVGLSMYKDTYPSSSFYIISTGNIEKEYLDSMRTLTEMYPDSIIDYYKKYGGLPSLDMNYTIFGHVFEGMDIVDKIYNIKHNQITLELDETIKIESIEFVIFE